VRTKAKIGLQNSSTICGQCISLGRDRGEVQGAWFAQSHSSACEPQSCAIESAGDREPPEEQGSGSHRARVRRTANITGRSDYTHDRHRAGESQDRLAESRLQYPPACDAGASSHSGRRTLITRLAERGVDLKAIAQIAGHTSIRTTAMYVEANPTRLARILQDVTF